MGDSNYPNANPQQFRVAQTSRGGTHRGGYRHRVGIGLGDGSESSVLTPQTNPPPRTTHTRLTQWHVQPVGNRILYILALPSNLTLQPYPPNPIHLRLTLTLTISPTLNLPPNPGTIWCTLQHRTLGHEVPRLGLGSGGASAYGHTHRRVNPP